MERDQSESDVFLENPISGDHTQDPRTSEREKTLPTQLSLVSCPCPWWKSDDRLIARGEASDRKGKTAPQKPLLCIACLLIVRPRDAAAEQQGTRPPCLTQNAAVAGLAGRVVTPRYRRLACPWPPCPVGAGCRAEVALERVLCALFCLASTTTNTTLRRDNDPFG